jgi:hypothetical protein
MFPVDRKVSVRVANISHEQMEKDEAEIQLVKLTCEINPLTPELASEVHDFVRGTLFTISGAEVNSLLSTASFSIFVPPQAIAFRSGPDTKKPAFTIDEAKVTGIKAKRSKKSSAWTLEFAVTCSPASEHQLAQICDSYLKSRYLSFSPAEPGLFDETPEVKGRGKSAAETDAEAEAEAEAGDVGDNIPLH